MPGAGLEVKEESLAHEIFLGPLRMIDVPVMEANKVEQVMDINFEASLGLAALKRLDVIIDGTHGVIFLRPKTDALLTTRRPVEHSFAIG